MVLRDLKLPAKKTVETEAEIKSFCCLLSTPCLFYVATASKIIISH